MKRSGRIALRCLLPALTLPALFGPNGAPAHPGVEPGRPSAQAAPAGAVARVEPTVRLRKLHLVRPDLIPYPIAYEVYC